MKPVPLTKMYVPPVVFALVGAMLVNPNASVFKTNPNVPLDRGGTDTTCFATTAAATFAS